MSYWAVGIVQVAEYLPSMHKSLGSTPHTRKKKKKAYELQPGMMVITLAHLGG
jgi:hypothetical protein